jgi:hypothetical protein
MKVNSTFSPACIIHKDMMAGQVRMHNTASVKESNSGSYIISNLQSLTK